MAAMTTTLKEFANNGNSRTFSLPGHTIAQPKVLIQKRKVPTSVDGVAEDSVKIVLATTDSAGVILSSKISGEVIIRRPVKGDAADVTDMKAFLLDLINSDEFSAVVTAQDWVK